MLSSLGRPHWPPANALLRFSVVPVRDWLAKVKQTSEI
jgi:hypothetical protein